MLELAVRVCSFSSAGGEAVEPLTSTFVTCGESLPTITTRVLPRVASEVAF
jgi:hypothetical protein